MSLSVVLATFNEEDTLARCLESVKDIADEIVVVDGRSTDKTVEIARLYGAKIKVVENEYIFHINKQKAVDLATKEWILQLDADEIVTEELREEIKDIVQGRFPEFKMSQFRESIERPVGYYLPRKNFFLGHWMRKGGQYPDPVIRFFRRGKGRFPQKSVHEQIVIDGSVGTLKNELLHYPYQTFAEYWEKAMRYSHLVAREMVQDRVSKNLITVLNYLLIKPSATFLNLFVRHQGFVDGVYGLLFAYFSGVQLQFALFKYLYGKNLD